jgi:hypothetical protein
MIPVEQTSTVSSPMPSASAAALAIARASRMPGSPVPALALPLLTMIAAALPPFSARRERDTTTGGATNLLRVNTAAQVTGCRSSVATSAMSGRRRLIPAWQPAATKPCAAVMLIPLLLCICRGGGPPEGRWRGILPP